MDINPIFRELINENIPLDQIFLDPNNPRFVDDHWDYIPQKSIDNDSIQENIQIKLINEFSVEKLIMNMEVNGYLPIDRVIVKKYEENKYVVLEGNRRICAAKKILSKYRDNSELVPIEIIYSLEVIPCLIYTGDNDGASWIFQGLRHISGLKEWSSFNKAKLLVDVMEEEDISLTEVGKRFGLTAHGAGQWVRGYSAFKQAKETSDYIIEIEEKSYPYFQELFGNSNKLLREWMDWDETERKFKNELNFNEFVGWIYPRINSALDDGEETSDKRGEFKHRLLPRSDDLRKVSFLLKESQQEFQNFRLSRDFDVAYSNALHKKYEKEKIDEDPVNEVFLAVEECIKALDNIPMKMLRNVESKRRLLTEIEKLETAIGYIKE